MTAIDSCEPQIIRALEKVGWLIVAKPHNIRLDERYLYADFKASRVTGNGIVSIVVMEVKCFTNPLHDLSELYTAIGQYRMYRSGMDSSGDTAIPLYLALPDVAYRRFEAQPDLFKVLRDSIVKWVVVDIQKESVTQWLD